MVIRRKEVGFSYTGFTTDNARNGRMEIRSSCPLILAIPAPSSVMSIHCRSGRYLREYSRRSSSAFLLYLCIRKASIRRDFLRLETPSSCLYLKMASPITARKSDACKDLQPCTRRTVQRSCHCKTSPRRTSQQPVPSAKLSVREPLAAPKPCLSDNDTVFLKFFTYFTFGGIVRR